MRSRISDRTATQTLTAVAVGLGLLSLAILVSNGSGTVRTSRPVPAGVKRGDEPSLRFQLPDLAVHGKLVTDGASRSAVAVELAFHTRRGTSRTAGVRDRSEREYHAAFLAIARKGPGELEARAATVLGTSGPDAEKVALLRALHDTGSPRVERFFSQAIRTLPHASGPHGESVPSFAIRFLGERSTGDAWARRLLERTVWGAPSPLPQSLRMRAAARLAEAATETELHRIAAYLQEEEDTLVTRSVVVALAANSNRTAVAALFGDDPPRTPEDRSSDQERIRP